MDKNYKNLVFSNHALEKLSKRRLDKEQIHLVVTDYRKKFKQNDETFKFIKRVGGRNIHVVATRLKEENKWLIVSVWVRGEDDQLPLIWQILSVPFRLIWFVFRTIYKLIVR